MGDNPLPRGLRLCRSYARYAQDLVKEHFGTIRAASLPNERVTSRFLCDVHKLVGQYLRAWNNPVHLPYTFEEVLEVVEGKGRKKDELLRKLFVDLIPNRKEGQGLFPMLTKPTVFLDKAGLVIAWYLPAAFTAKRCRAVFQSTHRLASKGPTILQDSSPSKSWRYRESTFSDPSKCRIKPGHANVSICWYNQAFDHRNSTPAPSANLRNPEGGGIDFLEDEFETNGLIGALLAIVHPDLFDIQMQVLEAVAREDFICKDRALMMQAFHHWTTPFSGFAIIANRETPMHRDLQGGKTLMDILSVFGEYTQGRLDVPLLHRRFMYNPGTAFVLPGGAFEHGASQTDGERICIASFLRPNVGYGALTGEYKELGPPSRNMFADTFGMIDSEPKSGGDIWDDIVS